MTVTHTGDLVSALLGVPGVAAAAVEPTDAGPGTLRLQLLPGADEVGVAGAVNRILRSRFGLAVDADRVRVLGEDDDGVVPGTGDPVGPAAEPGPWPAGPAVPPFDGPVPAGTEDVDALLDALRRSLSDLDGSDLGSSLDGRDLDASDLDASDLDASDRDGSTDRNGRGATEPDGTDASGADRDGAASERTDAHRADRDGADPEGTDAHGTDTEGADRDGAAATARPAVGGWPAPVADPAIAWAPPPAAAPRRVEVPRRVETPVGSAPATQAGTATPATRARPRLVIERVQLVSAGLTTSVTVVLGNEGRTVQGRAEGTATTGSLHRSVAAATLRAVESVVGEGVRFDIEHVEVARTGPDRTALVVLTMVTERATQRLSGASVVREDVRQAVIRAVLAAVNRRVEPLIPGAGDAPA